MGLNYFAPICATLFHLLALSESGDAKIIRQGSHRLGELFRRAGILTGNEASCNHDSPRGMAVSGFGPTTIFECLFAEPVWSWCRNCAVVASYSYAFGAIGNSDRLTLHIYPSDCSFHCPPIFSRAQSIICRFVVFLLNLLHRPKHRLFRHGSHKSITS